MVEMVSRTIALGLLSRCRSVILFVYTCIYICIYVYICMYTYILVFKLTYLYIGLHQDGGDGVDENISLPLCNYVHIHMYIYICIHVYIYMYIYLCIYVYIYMYIYILICKLKCLYIGLHKDGRDGVEENGWAFYLAAAL